MSLVLVVEVIEHNVGGWPDFYVLFLVCEVVE